jgi:hypothetical protein
MLFFVAFCGLCVEFIIKLIMDDSSHFDLNFDGTYILFYLATEYTLRVVAPQGPGEENERNKK